MSRARHTVLVGLIGAGIGASLSPALHEREAARARLRYVYRLLDIDELGPAAATSATLRARGPARRLARRSTSPTRASSSWSTHLDELSPEAAALGAVNTVVLRRRPRGRPQHRRDRLRRGFARGLPDAALDRVVLLGAGGAGAAVAHALLHARRAAADHRRRRRATARARRSPRPARRRRARAAARRSTRCADADGLVHATPTGMAAHPGLPLAAGAAATRACGSPTSSTGRWRPSCCATRARARLPHARRRRHGASSRRRARSGCSPASSPTASGCSPTSPSSTRAGGGADAPLDRHGLPERHARGEARRRGARAGFDGVELFEPDLIASPLRPAEVRARAARPRPDDRPLPAVPRLRGRARASASRATCAAPSASST